MNATTQTRPVQAARPVAVVSPPPRSREFGIGYGRSSGYASQPRYAASAFTPRFRCS